MEYLKREIRNNIFAFEHDTFDGKKLTIGKIERDLEEMKKLFVKLSHSFSSKNVAIDEITQKTQWQQEIRNFQRELFVLQNDIIDNDNARQINESIRHSALSTMKEENSLLSRCLKSLKLAGEDSNEGYFELRDQGEHLEEVNKCLERNEQLVREVSNETTRMRNKEYCWKLVLIAVFLSLTLLILLVVCYKIINL